MLILKKENGVVRYYLSEEAAGITGKCHLCAEDCKNLSPDVCSKVEMEKKRIGEYDYITDGYQVFVEKKGEERKLYLKCFVVSGCSNYEKEVRQPSCGDKESREKLLKMYFNCDTIDEASRLMDEMIAKGKKRDQQSRKRVRSYTSAL